MNDLNQIRLQRLGLILTSPTYAYKALKGALAPIGKLFTDRRARKAWLKEHMVINTIYAMLIGVLFTSAGVAAIYKYAMWAVENEISPWLFIFGPFLAAIIPLACFLLGVFIREKLFKDI